MPEPPAEALGEDLAAWGQAIIISTTGRRSGRPRRVAVGFVEDADGNLLVSAGDGAAHWALNLAADPHCLVTREGRELPHVAQPLDDAAHRDVVRALILRYGTPAERLGQGPSFRLVPVPPRPPGDPSGGGVD